MIGPLQPAPVAIDRDDLPTSGPLAFTEQGEENTYFTRMRDGRVACVKV